MSDIWTNIPSGTRAKALAIFDRARYLLVTGKLRALVVVPLGIDPHEYIEGLIIGLPEVITHELRKIELTITQLNMNSTAAPPESLVSIMLPKGEA